MVCISLGFKELRFLKNYNLEYNKIASMIVDLKLLEEVAKEKNILL